MKMLMAVVPKKNGDDLLSLLVNAGYTATFSETRGGMLRQSQLSLFTAVKGEEVPKVLDIIRGCCSTGINIHHGYGLIDSEMREQATPSVSGGAVVFVWSLDSFSLS